MDERYCGFGTAGVRRVDAKITEKNSDLMLATTKCVAKRVG